MFRTQGEIEYLENLNLIPEEPLADWRGINISSMDAWCATKPQLVAEFRYTGKMGTYFDVYVWNERRMRSRYGRAIPHQILSTFKLCSPHFEQAFAELTAFWQSIEVPRGCSVEIPMVFTYKKEELIDQESRWWVVAYTEFAAKTAEFILYEVWDNFRLSGLSRDMIRLIERLDLEVVLGNAANADELRALLEVIRIRNTRFPEIPKAWRARGTMQIWLTGQRGAGGEWVYYDPKWKMYIQSKTEARAKAFNRISWMDIRVVGIMTRLQRVAGSGSCNRRR